VASLIGSLLSWNWLPIPAYSAKAAMLCALLHSLVGLGIATQQSVALSRVSLHPQRIELVNRVVFDSETAITVGCGPKAEGWRDFSWQIPTMMLGNSIVFIIIGLAIAIFSEALKAGGFGPEVKIAIAFTISLSFSVSCYLASWMCIEVRLQKAMQ
jgi:hypothetical protein